MTYEEFVKNKIINKNVEHYDILIKSVLQFEVAPSIYLKGILSKQKVSIGLLNIFGNLVSKSKHMSYNTYFLQEYKKEYSSKDTKVCSSCKKDLDLSHFHANGYHPSGNKKFKAKCKVCSKQTEVDRKIDLIEKVFKSYSCTICGYNKCRQALEFHHVDPKVKEYKISDIMSYKESIILAELSKCILVCANCHREIHYGLHPQYIIT